MAEKQMILPDRYQPGFLAGLDRRTELYKTLRGNYEAICEDVGGEESLPHTMVAIVERFVFMEAMLQRMELQICTNPELASELVNKWIQGVNSLQGLAGRIGFERVARPTMNLKSYLAEDDE